MAKHFNFANEDTEPANGKTAKSVTIPFSNYSTCKMKYSAKSKTYKKYEYGQKHMDLSLIHIYQWRQNLCRRALCMA